MRSVVQPALRLALSGPPAGAGILAGRDRLGARHATDGRVALVDQRVDGHVVVLDVAGNVEVRPGRDRVDLDEATEVADDDRGLAPRRRLDPAEAAHPRLLAGQGAVE